MNVKLLDALESCLEEIENGSTIDVCLLKYPEFAEELRPSLEAALIARRVAVIDVPSRSLNRSRSQVLGYAARLRSEKKHSTTFRRYPAIVFSALLLALVLILGSRELAVVSAESLPGDRFYPFKRAVEDIKVRFAPNQEAQLEMEVQYREQRIEEVMEVLDHSWTRMVTFEGVVQQLNPGEWIVGEILVKVNDDTVLLGDIHLGSLIEVEGLTTIQGWVEAHEVHLREYEFIGRVDTINRDVWIISNVSFEIISLTRIDSSIQIGDIVLTLARTRDSDTQYALAILRLPRIIDSALPSEKDIGSLIVGKHVGDEFQISGIVSSISATEWIIDGYSVSVALNTEVNGSVGIGDYVQVQVILGENESLTALEIEPISQGIDIGEDNQLDDDNNNAREEDQETDDRSEDDSKIGDDVQDQMNEDKDNSGSGDDFDRDHGSGENEGSDDSDDSGSDAKDDDNDSSDENNSGSDQGSDDGSDEDPEEPEEPDDPDGTATPEETEQPQETDVPNEPGD